MKQQSLFRKTWLIVVTSIILTVSILGLMVSVFANNFIYDVQQVRFERLIDDVVFAFANENSETVLDKYQSMDLAIIVGKDDDLLIPSDFLEGAELGDLLLGSDGTSKTAIIYGSSSSEFFVTFRTLLIDGEQSSLVVRYPVILGTNEMGAIIVRISPYFLLITLVVTSVVALVYARYFSKRIRRVSDVVQDMGRGSHSVDQKPLAGDEIQVLENDINIMYQQLQNTLGDLNIEVQTVHRLEEDRKLFMRGTIHELKTPIMTMSLDVEKQLREHSQPFLIRLNQRLGSMSKLIQELLEMSSHEEITDFSTICVNDVVHEVSQVYTYLLEDNQNKLLIDEQATLELVIPHKSLVKIISNLLGNAIKYSVFGSDISITINTDGFHIRNHFQNKQQLKDIKLEEPFVSIADESDLDSNGLGLYLVKSLSAYYGLDSRLEIKDDVFIYYVSNKFLEEER